MHAPDRLKMYSVKIISRRHWGAGDLAGRCAEKAHGYSKRRLGQSVQQCRLRDHEEGQSKELHFIFKKIQLQQTYPQRVSIRHQTLLSKSERHFNGGQASL